MAFLLWIVGRQPKSMWILGSTRGVEVEPQFSQEGFAPKLLQGEHVGIRPLDDGAQGHLFLLGLGIFGTPLAFDYAVANKVIANVVGGYPHLFSLQNEGKGSDNVDTKTKPKHGPTYLTRVMKTLRRLFLGITSRYFPSAET